MTKGQTTIYKTLHRFWPGDKLNDTRWNPTLEDAMLTITKTKWFKK